MLNGRFLRALAIGVPGTIFLATLLAVMWQADKGIGFGDEGIYLLAARYPQEIQQNVSAVFQFTGLLFSLAGHDVTGFRLLGVFANLLSAAWLWFGFYRLARFFGFHGQATAAVRYAGLLFILLGSLLHYQWSYLTPSYYTLTAIGVNLFAGCLFHGLAALEARNGRAALAACFATGLVFGFVLFFKFPTAFALLGMTCGMLLCWRGIERGLRMRLLLALAGGFFAWLALYFLLAQGPARTAELFLQGWALYQSLGYHNPADKLLAYPLDLLVVLRTAIVGFLGSYLVLAAGALLAWILRRSRPRYAGWAGILSIWISVLHAVVASIPSGMMVNVPERLQTAPVDGVTRFYLVSIFAWLLLAGAIRLAWMAAEPGRARSSSGKVNFLLLLAFLLAAPVAASLGTSNPLYNVLSFYVVPWFGGIVLLLARVGFSCGAMKPPALAIGLAICLFVSSNVIQGGIYQPAQIKPRTLLQQIDEVSVADSPRPLKVDPDTRNLISELSTALHGSGFKRGDDIIGFDQIAGLVYALGARSPGHPVFPCCAGPRDLAYSKRALQFASKDRLAKAFVLLDVHEDEKVARVAEIMRDAGLAFPENYRVLLVAGGLGRRFTLYAPRLPAD